MTRLGVLALALVALGLPLAAPAHGASMVFIKKSNVWMARADGSGQVRLTRDGRRGSPYFSPSIADDGTIVALESLPALVSPQRPASCPAAPVSH